MCGAAACMRAGVSSGPVFSIRLANMLRLAQTIVSDGGWPFLGRLFCPLAIRQTLTAGMLSGLSCAPSAPRPIALSQGQPLPGFGHDSPGLWPPCEYVWALESQSIVWSLARIDSGQ